MKPSPADERVNLPLTTSIQQPQAVLCPHQQIHTCRRNTRGLSTGWTSHVSNRLLNFGLNNKIIKLESVTVVNGNCEMMLCRSWFMAFRNVRSFENNLFEMHVHYKNIQSRHNCVILLSRKHTPKSSTENFCVEFLLVLADLRSVTLRSNVGWVHVHHRTLPVVLSFEWITFTACCMGRKKTV